LSLETVGDGSRVGLVRKPEPNQLVPAKSYNKNSTAFTLHELLVVVAVLLLLGSVVVSSCCRAASRQIKRAQCAANLRQFAQATHLYATENRDRLPEITSGSWAWDLPVSITSSLQGFGMEKRSFYCPGTAPRFNDHLNFLNASMNSLWNWGESSPGTGFRIIGYVTAFNGSGFAITSTNQNKTILAERATISLFTDHPPQPNNQRVLLADATISVNPAGTGAAPAAAGSFTSVVGGFPVPHLSPHLKGNLPAGGNLAFKDGHVAWREFKDMSQRATGSSRGFWW
jgi:type II secretory pathway pseudopilin PulG